MWELGSLFEDPCWNLRLMGIILAVALASHTVALSLWVQLGQEAVLAQSVSNQRYVCPVPVCPAPEWLTQVLVSH